MPITIKRKNGPSKMEHRLVIGCLKGMAGWGDLVAQRASDNAPVDTTNLATSIHRSDVEEVEKLSFTVLVGTNVEYARAQEMGSGLYAEGGSQGKIPIVAGFWTGKSTKKALAFEWPGGPTDHPAYDKKSRKFLFHSVMHPGVHPQPYLRPALEDTREDGRKLLLSSIAAELRR